jgi:hypothetical protein
MMKIFKKLSIIVLSTLSFSQSYGLYEMTTKLGRCQDAYRKVLNSTGTADACKTACDLTGLVRGTFISYDQVKVLYDYCAGAPATVAGAAAPGTDTATCEAGEAMLKDGRTHEQSEWQTCKDSCDLAAVVPGLSSDLMIKYSNTAASCSDKLSGTAVVDSAADDGGSGADDAGGDTGGGTTGDVPVADTGSPNTPALNAALSGLGGSSSVGKIDAGRPVNFRGTGGSKGSYGDVASGVGALGHQGSDILPPQQINNGYQGAGGEVKADVANFGGGSGGGGGGGMGGGAGGGGAPRAGGAGGPRQTAAGAQLAKGTNQFWAGGGSGGSPAKPVGRATAGAVAKNPLAEKPKYGPEYLNKGVGNDGLLRLWGAGNGQNRLPINRDSQSCRDGVIFCNLENFNFEFAP